MGVSVLAIAPLVPIDVPPASVLAGTCGLALIAGAAGVVAGSLVPWGPGPGQQIAAFAALVSVVTVLAAAATAIANGIAALGIPEVIAGAFVAAGLVTTAAMAVVARNPGW
jgi:hypothetical protein